MWRGGGSFLQMVAAFPETHPSTNPKIPARDDPMTQQREWFTACHEDSSRLAVFQECLETYGMESKNAESEWPWNVLSKVTVAYTCGQFGRRGEATDHRHDPAEFVRCQQLAAEVTSIMQGADIGMGSNDGNPFRPYYRVANIDNAVPENVTEPACVGSASRTISRGMLALGHRLPTKWTLHFLNIGT